MPLMHRRTHTHTLTHTHTAQCPCCAVSPIIKARVWWSHKAGLSDSSLSRRPLYAPSLWLLFFLALPSRSHTTAKTIECLSRFNNGMFCFESCLLGFSTLFKITSTCWIFTTPVLKLKPETTIVPKAVQQLRFMHGLSVMDQVYSTMDSKPHIPRWEKESHCQTTISELLNHTGVIKTKTHCY